MSGPGNPGRRQSRRKPIRADTGKRRIAPGFSARTAWDARPNALTRALESRLAHNLPILDLTGSNPTTCGLVIPAEDILRSLQDRQILTYRPDPHGLLSARSAIVAYYRSKNVSVEASRLFLTASSSEAYSILFTLLCNAGDAVLAPRPSYPLFHYLAGMHDLSLRYYDLRYDHGWEIDVDALSREITRSTKAIILINPNNPTGSFLKRDEHEHLVEIARRRRIALIADEVFIDYPFGNDERRYGTTAADPDALTFTLNGISKTIGLPQMKLGWIAVGGESDRAAHAVERLEVICDTFLSVGSPVQVALPRLMIAGNGIRESILDRVSSNYGWLAGAVGHDSPCAVLQAEGGWYGIVRVPRTRSDEQWAVDLLEKRGVYVFPGFFFDFEAEACLVVSLLTRGDVFREGIDGLIEFASGK